jgi:transposase
MRLSHILETHDYRHPCFVPGKERREDRQVSRTLIAVQKDIIRTRNRIRKLLDFHGIDAPLKTNWGKKEFQDLRGLALMESLKASLCAFLTILEELWNQQTILRDRLRDLCRKERYHKAFETARSLPGIGWYTAIRLILEMGEDLSRFESGKKMAAFVGLTCSEHSTGDSQRKGRITGIGSGFIRSTLIESSWTAIRKDQALLAKFIRVWRSSGSKKKAIVAVARVLIVRFRACLISGEPYRIGLVR